MNREALKEIEKQIADAGYVYDDFLDICKEALEKQMPKQVKKVRHETILGYAVTVHCPFCGGSVWQNADESNYCFRCGQKLDWEVSE